ncbi:hypothetical protein GCM10027589_19510 [Actinocorallia lasiicapitis]
MAQRTRKQALLPVTVGAVVAGVVCYGVASIPTPDREGRRTAAGTEPLADASITARARGAGYTVRVANTGPDATGRLVLGTGEPVDGPIRTCAKTPKPPCAWPDGLEPGMSVTFTFSTWPSQTLAVHPDVMDWSPANNVAHLYP